MKQQDPKELAQKISQGDRRSLARAITLVESENSEHSDIAQDILGNLSNKDQALRIGLSGTPGVGKSTFIEAFGMYLVNAGHRVAVLAVDPSSSRSGGSILGDKTRMDLLSREKAAFIRPSPSRAHLGGVARRTREAAALCSAAGFDIVLIETVGVGQSETMVADMVDVFLLLMAPAGGDELQGVKRGIMEMSDIILVNKADGELLPVATRTCADYAGALRLLRKRSQDPEGFPLAMMVSAVEHFGLSDVWTTIQDLVKWRKEHGHWDQIRESQAVHWFDDEVKLGLLAQLFQNNSARELREDLLAQVKTQGKDPRAAAQIVINKMLGQSS